MQGRIFGYSAVYFLAFCFFSVVFHAFANANTEPVKKEIVEIENWVPSIIISPTIIPLPTATSTPVPMPTATSVPLPTPTAFPSPVQKNIQSAPGDLESLFQKYSDEYIVDRELLKSIAACESGFNAGADTGLYAGMFQFAEQTWVSVRSQMGLDGNPELRKNAEESIRTAAYMVSRGRQSAWANCLP